MRNNGGWQAYGNFMFRRRLKSHGIGANLAAAFFTRMLCLPGQRVDAMLKEMLCAAAIALMMAAPAVKAADLDAAEAASLKADAERGDAVAQCALGWCYDVAYCEGLPHDPVKACEWYGKAAAQGNVDAQVNLGLMYARGRGVQQDYARAREWFEKAAAQGDAVAQINMGVLYDNGHGVRQDKAAAREWFGKACGGGHQKGCDYYRLLDEAGY